MTYIESTRKYDKQSEEAINAFLARFFYPKLFKKFRFETNETRQKAGVDFEADGLLIDNKAMSSPRFVNNPAKTFILELLVHSDKYGEYLGWFVNPNIITTHYLFIWIPEAKVGPSGYILDSREIQKIEVMLVDRTKLHQEINAVCSDERLLQVAHDMVAKNSLDREIPEFGYYKCPHFVYSTQLNEKPVNLVTPKDWLKRAAIKHCFVTAKEIIDIP